jgi:hypothetical protein
MLRLPISLERYVLAVNALRFFSLPASSQVRGFKQHVGEVPLLLESSIVPGAGDYFRSVHAVFITYVGFIYDRFQSSEDALAINEFKRLVDELACYEGGEFWSEHGTLTSERWAEMRTLASRAMAELGEQTSSEPPRFDFESEINPHEFRTSDDVRRLLD